MDERELLARVRESLRRRDLREAGRYLFDEIYGEDVTLTDPEWWSVWEVVRPTMPPSIAKRLDPIFERITPTEKALLDLRLADGDRVTFLLGAGASKPEPSGLPTVEELLPELWRRAAKLGREDLKSLQEWCEHPRRAIKNIEDLLTAAYIANFSSRNSGVLALLDYFLYRQRVSAAPEEEPRTVGARRAAAAAALESDVSAIALLQDTLQTLFGLLLGRMILAQPNAAHAAIASLAKERGRVSVVTTNYDGCIDQAMTDDGLRADYLVEMQRPENSCVTIVKMHGSINWSYCDSCQEMKLHELAHMRKSYEADTLSFPVIGICKNCGGQRRPMVVPPMSFKVVMFPPLLALWDQAQAAFNDSSIIVSVGYSFSEADIYITKMISRAMGQDRNKKLVVVDPNPQLVRILRERLGALIDDFDPSRVIRSCESCEVIVPQFAESLVAAPVKSKAKKNGGRPAPKSD